MKRLNTILATLIIALLMFGYTAPGAYAYGKANLGVTSATIRTAAILTTDYVATSSTAIDKYNQLNLSCSFIVGSSTGVKLIVEVSDDETTWYQIHTATVSATGLVTLAPAEWTKTATGNFPISIPIGGFEFYRVSAKALTTATGTSLSIVATVGIL